MKSIRLYIDEPLAAGRAVRLGRKASHYLRNVLRLREGAVIHTFDGLGGYYITSVRLVGSRSVTVLPEEHVANERESTLDITLVQGIARGQKMDYTIQKAVELGVNRVIPVVTEFSQVKLNPDRADKRLSHWRGIVINACEQCGRNRLPRVESPLPLVEWMRSEDEGAKWMLHPGAAFPLVNGDPSATGRIILLAGPEGGLSDQDRDQARNAGYQAVSLGPRILRAETAAVAALATCQALWGDFHQV